MSPERNKMPSTIETMLRLFTQPNIDAPLGRKVQRLDREIRVAKRNSKKLKVIDTRKARRKQHKATEEAQKLKNVVKELIHVFGKNLLYTKWLSRSRSLTSNGVLSKEIFDAYSEDCLKTRHRKLRICQNDIFHWLSTFRTKPDAP